MKSNTIYSLVSYRFVLMLLTGLTLITGCKKILDIPLPANKIAGDAAYSTDRSSAATLSTTFASLAGSGFFDGQNGLGYNTGLYTDDLTNINSNSVSNRAYYSNAIGPANTGPVWSSLYQNIYNINLTLEGVSASAGLLNRDQWLGEAYFLRAFCYFYLTNYFGDVALATSSNFLINKDLARIPKAEVYKQMIADLLKAESLLSNEYRSATSATTTSRCRPNKFAAAALLARIYLYTGDWKNAEIQANNVINADIGASGVYSLLPSASIDKVFLASSTETIFSLATTGLVKDYYVYNNNMPATFSANWPINGVSAKISPSLLAAFETNMTVPAAPTADLRKTFWTRSTTKIGAETYFFPNKYKSTVIGAENIVLCRLAEQYLIRAEAHAMQNELDDAKADLNTIRSRAGLAGTTATSKVDLVAAILKEKRTELFSEVGHRFFDLKRTGTIDEVMNIEAPLKGVGAVWNTLKQYFPISTYDISVDAHLTQTPGY